MALEVSLIRLYFQNDTSVYSDQLSIHFRPRLTLGLVRTNSTSSCTIYNYGGHSWGDYILQCSFTPYALQFLQAFKPVGYLGILPKEFHRFCPLTSTCFHVPRQYIFGIFEIFWTYKSLRLDKDNCKAVLHCFCRSTWQPQLVR